MGWEMGSLSWRSGCLGLQLQYLEFAEAPTLGLSEKIGHSCMMVNLMCHHDRAKGCPECWETSLLDVSVGVFLEKISAESGH